MQPPPVQVGSLGLRDKLQECKCNGDNQKASSATHHGLRCHDQLFVATYLGHCIYTYWGLPKPGLTSSYQALFFDTRFFEIKVLLLLL